MLLEDLCGAAGFAVVKLATDKQTGEQFACKIMNLPPEGVDVGENENSRCVCAEASSCLCRNSSALQCFLYFVRSPGN